MTDQSTEKTCAGCEHLNHGDLYGINPPEYKCEKYGCLVRTTDTCKGEQNAQKQKEGKEA